MKGKRNMYCLCYFAVFPLAHVMSQPAIDSNNVPKIIRNSFHKMYGKVDTIKWYKDSETYWSYSAYFEDNKKGSPSTYFDSLGHITYVTIEDMPLDVLPSKIS